MSIDLKMRRILVVQEGRHGSVPASAYAQQARLAARHVQEFVARRTKDGAPCPDIHVECVEHREALLQRLTEVPVSTVLFLSRSMTDLARSLAPRFPATRFIIWTGHVPEEEVIFIGKAWHLNSEAFASILINS
jgi:hypothetical protein